MSALCKATRKAGEPLRLTDLPRDLAQALLHHFGSIARARRIARLPGPKTRRRWSLEFVVAEIKKLDRAGFEIRKADLLGLGRGDLVKAAEAYARGLDRARQLAGVPAPPRRSGLAPPWDAQAVISEILRRKKAGEPLAHSKAPPPLARAAYHFFGSWAAAIEEAGLDYDRIRLQRPAYDKRELLDIVRNLARKYPDATLVDFSRAPLGRYRAPLARRFGGVAQAAVAAGLKGWPVRQKHALMSADQVKAALRKRHRSGKAMRQLAVAQEDPNLMESLRRRFGSWRKALHAAGLATRVPMPRTWTPDSVVRSLRQRHRKGLSMDPVIVRREDSGLVRAAWLLYGSYWAAARHAGIPRPPRGRRRAGRGMSR